MTPQENRGARPRRWPLRTIVVLGSILGAVATAEIVMRVWYPVAYMGLRDEQVEWQDLLHRKSKVPGLAYEPNPGSIGFGGAVRINQAGMRDADPLPSDTPNLVRLAAVGDSFTFGFYVPGELAWPNVLERLLQEQDGTQRFEVLNLGVGGYCARDAAAVVEHKLSDWRPRLLILGYVLNDPELDPIQPLHAAFEDRPAWKSSHALRQLAEWREQRRIRRLGGGDYFRYLHHPDGAKWRSVEDSFRRIADRMNAEDVPVLLLIFPFVPQRSWDTYAYADLHEQVRRAGEAVGFDVLDLLESYRLHPPGGLRVNPKDEHPSPIGHRVAAEAIRDRLLEHHRATLSLGE